MLQRIFLFLLVVLSLIDNPEPQRILVTNSLLLVKNRIKGIFKDIIMTLMKDFLVGSYLVFNINQAVTGDALSVYIS